jgi:hypothetical protein
MTLQNVKSPNFRNFGTTNLGIPRQNDIWMHPPWLIIEYYKGEGGGFP